MNAVTIACDNWNPLESYGQIAAAITHHFSHDHGVYVNAVTGHRPLEEIGCPATRELLERAHRSSAGGIILGYPTLMGQYDGDLTDKPLVAVTMFESTALPDGWAASLNRCNAVVVPAAWLVDVFRSAGVTSPIHVAPLGISSHFKYVCRPENRRPFTFLIVASRGLRKGWDVAVRAFDQAFGTDDHYRLLIKLRVGRQLGVGIRHPNVTILAADLDEIEMQDLYESVDAFLCPSRGEGFGLPPREAAATGLPVIATSWGGTGDDLFEWGTPLSYSLTTAWPYHPRHPRCGQWAEPDVNELACLMRQVADSPRDNAAAEARSRRVAALYDWGRFSAAVLGILRETIDASSAGGVKAGGQRKPVEDGGSSIEVSRVRSQPKPRVVIHANPDVGWQERFVHIATTGMRSIGLPFRVTSEAVRRDEGLPILLGTTFWRAVESSGPFLLVDRCSYGDPGRFVSLVRDGHGRRGDHRVPISRDGSRWERHQEPVLPWQPRGTEIVLCGQTESYSPRYKRLNDWYADVAGLCSQFRPHPASRPEMQCDSFTEGLRETRSWDACGLAVTLNSSVAVEAVLAGIPTITMDEAAMAWDVTGHHLHDVIMPDRTAWLHWLAWTQWSYDEINEGIPWSRFLD